MRHFKVWTLTLATLALTIPAVGYSADRGQAAQSDVAPSQTLNASRGQHGRLCKLPDQKCVAPQRPRLCLAGTTKCAGATRPTFIPVDRY